MSEKRYTVDDLVGWYTSNSYRRLGLLCTYRELMYPVVCPDGVGDIEFAHPDVQERIVACWNACAGVATEDLMPDMLKEALKKEES